MKILLYTDIHISQDSSIVKGKGAKYSKRLDNIIDSINWAERLAEQEHCGLIVNLGDTFNAPIIKSIEATAIQDIRWANIEHKVLVGNHDSDMLNLEYSSVDVLRSLGFDVINIPWKMKLPDVDVDFYFLPYMTESNRIDLNQFICESNNKKIIFSHNDIAGVQMGKFKSQDGFEVEDIEKNCDLFLNGHLHNMAWVTNKILNLGNLTGQNFGEDSFKYSHGCWILDTDTLKMEFYENPYSFNFYKVEINDTTPTLPKFKNNPVVIVKCQNEYKEQIKQELEAIGAIYKIIVFYKELPDVVVEEGPQINKIDYIEKFKEYMREVLGNTEPVNNELIEIFKEE